MLITWGLQDQYLSRRDIAHSRAVSHQSSQELHLSYTQTNRISTYWLQTRISPLLLMANIHFSKPSWYVRNLTCTDTHRQKERVTESVCVREIDPLVVFLTSPLRNHLAFRKKSFMFLLSGQTKKIILMMPEPQMTPQIFMIPRQIAKVKPANPSTSWWRRHHKGCCEFMLHHPWHSTDSTWTAPRLQGTNTAWLPGGGLPRPHPHDSHHHILMLQTNISQLSFKSCTHCHPVESPLLQKIFSWSLWYLRQYMSIREMISKDECHCKHLCFSSFTFYTWAPFQIWTTDIFNLFWHLCGFQHLSDILSEYHLSPIASRSSKAHQLWWTSCTVL